MRILLILLIYSIPLWVAGYLIVEQPIQKFDNSSNYFVSRSRPGGSILSSSQQSGASLNSSENWGYALFLIFLGTPAWIKLCKIFSDDWFTEEVGGSDSKAKYRKGESKKRSQGYSYGNCNSSYSCGTCNAEITESEYYQSIGVTCPRCKNGILRKIL